MADAQSTSPGKSFSGSITMTKPIIRAPLRLCGRVLHPAVACMITALLLGPIQVARGDPIPPDMPAMDHAATPPPTNPAPVLVALPAPAPQPGTMSDMPGMPGMHHGTEAEETGMTMLMPGQFGPYSMVREASGTSWQPDSTPSEGVHLMADDWMLMGHANIFGVYDHQGDARGGDKTFAAGMVMGMAQHPLGDAGTLGFRAMLSPDLFMGPNGYPLLFATGETANGRTPLIDRQHPHDLFMELSGSYSYRLSDTNSAFDPPPLKWSTLSYGFCSKEGPRCQGKSTSRKRLSRSCGRLML
jgi:hypothetical protein